MTATKNRHETPIKRTNPSGKVVWVARRTNRHGQRKSAGTFELRRDAQDAIDAAYAREIGEPWRVDTVGAYFLTWTQRHPRADRTNKTNEHRVSRVLDLKLDGRALRDWPYGELRRRHAVAIVDHLLREQKGSARGATHIIRALSAMTSDAIDDEVVEANVFLRLGIKVSDPRVTKQPRAVRVCRFPQMHALAAAAARVRDADHDEPTELERWRSAYAEPMLRVLSDCGLRLGELLPLERRDVSDGLLRVERTAHDGVVLDGTKTDHGEQDAGRVVPVPPSLDALIRSTLPRIDTMLLFPTPTGRLWRERNFYWDVWQPARDATGMDCRPHEFRHSWITHLRAAGVNDADLADMAGHTVATMHAKYAHALHQSFDQVRKAIG
jgi:integrase